MSEEALPEALPAPGRDMPPVFLAIGASGARTGSLLRLVRTLPSEPTLATILVLSDREALDEEEFRQALSDRGHPPTVPADGDRVEPGHLYLPGPDFIATVEEGRIRTRPAEQEPGGRGTVDSLLVSLAGDQDGNAIAVILEGTGGDGTLGVAAVKEGGGFAIAEAGGGADPDTGKPLPGPASLGDFVLPVEEMPERILLHIRQHARLREAGQLEARPDEEAGRLAAIAAILREKTGHDFHGYKRATFLRRVQRRMQVLGVAGYGAYLDALRARPEEPQSLFNDLLIGVTQFFRDRREFGFLEAHVIPRLFEGKGRDDQLRVWVLGCSTGEEAYSIAILLREHAATLEDAPQIQIFASDIDGRALAVARVGRYPRSIARDIRPDRLARWFVEEGDTYCVLKELREACIFSQHSIVRDPPFSRLDLVSCRNLLIYLGTDLQNRVIPLFHFALRPGGYLFLGNAENVSRHADLFEPVDRSYRVFRRIAAPARVLPDFSFGAIPRESLLAAASPAPRFTPRAEELTRRAERIAQRYAPAYAIVDERFDVLHFSAKAGRFIHPAGGAASLNLLNLVHGDLRPELRSALMRAAAEGEAAQVTGVEMRDGARSIWVDLVVEPAPDGEPRSRAFAVLFDERRPPAGIAEEPPPSAQGEHVRRLEAELRVTRERLNTMVEELQSTNEELRSANEEYQSLNEELQSANEELQTSKEELQSVNEEVTTVNGELAHRVQELARANSDLKNLLESTQIATIFLDNELRVTNFTPAAAEIFHLVDTDVGRPIGHIKSRVAYDDLQEDARRVIRTLAATSREVSDPATHGRYVLRVLPYRSVDNYIEGAVVTFTDVSPIARAERALRESEERLRLLTERIPQLVWTAVDRGQWTWTSRQWTEYTGQPEAEALGTGWLHPLHPDDRAAATAAWAAATENGAYDAEFRVASSDGTFRWFHSRATPFTSEGGRTTEWFGTSTDIHEMRELRERQGILVAELQHRTRNLLGVVRSIASQTLGDCETFDEYAARLSAIGRVQGFLARSGTWSASLLEIVEAELRAAGEGGTSRAAVEGPPVDLPGDAVQPVALVLHELATNALKHGALSRPDARLAVTWTLDGEGDGRVLRLTWEESGVPMPGDGPPARKGYGRELIERALPYQLRAETQLMFGPDGVRCRISLPLPEATERT